MKYFLTFLLSFLIVFAYGQDSIKRTASFAIQLNQDNAFNFYPAIFASLPLKKMDLSFYAIFWTTAAFANPDGTGSFVEAGIGVNLVRGNFTINPSIGLGNGIYTNGRDTNNFGRATIAESIVPSITSFYRDDLFESEVFVAAYEHLRKEVRPVTDYILFWLLPGVRIGSSFSSGLHYEQFRDITNGEATYVRYGCYGKLTIKERYEIRLSLGLNYTQAGNTSKQQGDFYKMTANIPF